MTTSATVRRVFWVSAVLWADLVLVYVLVKHQDWFDSASTADLLIGGFLVLLGPPLIIYGIARALIGAVDSAIGAGKAGKNIAATSLAGVDFSAAGLMSMVRSGFDRLGGIATKVLGRTIRIALGIVVLGVGLWSASEFFDLVSVPFSAYSLAIIGKIIFFAWLAFALIVGAFRVAFGAPWNDSNTDKT